MIDLPAPDPGIEIVLASRGMSKGLAQTRGPQIVVRGELGFGATAAGLQYKNISSATADGEVSVSWATSASCSASISAQASPISG